MSKKPSAKDLFERGIHVNSKEIDAWLDAACQGDTELRQRVNALLQAHRHGSAFFESSTGANAFAQGDSPTRDDAHCDAQQGDRIGPYTLLEEIGRGGMGSVWVAKQTEPMKRKVAIKLIKAGMDSRQVLSRFDVERQALALMDHPNIARVIDGGVTPDGRPFFAMEYVKGVPLTEYCDQAKLTVRERLQLFIPICQAIQHAHQKGIIHRDLKPSNILICLFDGKPVPKIIDFGLAKAMHQPLTDESVYTGHGVVVGTPLYMSPEQAEYNNLDIDTRTDIYALGVILYELLTGTTPLERAQMKKAAFNEVLRLIKELDPPKPSSRISGDKSLPHVAAQRGIDPNRLTRSLIGDLDWVVMKALEKERSRRYVSADRLAEDLRRHLIDEPVEAGPPSVRYRIQKFVKRNRAAVLATGVVATVFAASFGMAVWFWAQREAALDQLAREQKDASVTTDVLEALVQDDYQWLSPDQQSGMAGSLSRAGAVLKSQGSGVSPVVKGTIQNVIFAQKASVGELEAASEGLSEVVKNLAASSPAALKIRAEAHFHLAETLWSLGDREGASENFEEALQLAGRGGFELDGAHYAAGYSGVFISRALQAENPNARRRWRARALELIEQAEKARSIGSDDSERAYLLAQYQRADLLSWVDEKSDEGIKLLRHTIKRQLSERSRATVDALQTSFVQLWSTLIEKSGDLEAAVEVASWWENEAKQLVGPASSPAIEARRYLAETYNMMGQPEKSVSSLDGLFDDVVRWHGVASRETNHFVTRYYLPYMQHFGEAEREAIARERIKSVDG